jgi:heterodisulfide reductase subunit A
MSEEIRIGVFICRCGSNIAGFLSTDEVADYAARLPNVVFIKENLYTCSESGTSEIHAAVREHSLNRVVVASCTPRTHEPTFRAACREAGLNPFLFEFVNIREHCSWVHQKERDRATAKARDLVRMGVARAALLEPLEAIEVEVVPRALVVGGGIAGMTSALAIARQGFEVTLVEREPELGGLLKKLYRLYPGNVDAAEFLKKKLDEVAANPRIRVLASSELVELKGFIGNFEAKIRGRGDLFTETFGTIIIATGARVFRPDGLYGYGAPNVITHLELEEMLKRGEQAPASVVMMQCVGARTPERKYCSRICCMTSVKNALLLKRANPETQVTILYREMQTYGDLYEDYFRKAREAGVVFVKYALGRPPVVGQRRVQVYGALLGEEFEIEADLVVLATPLVSSEKAGELSRLLRIAIDQHHFFLEAHAKLKPLDVATDGIYLAGAARFPADVRQSVSEGYGAAARALAHLISGRVLVDPIVSTVDASRCIACGLCEQNCTYNAIAVEESGEGRKARAISASCRGCGTCAAGCPMRAIEMRHYTDAQMEAVIFASEEVGNDG